MNKSTLIYILGALILGIIMGSQIRCGCGKAQTTTVTKRDTTYVPRTDTLYKERIVLQPKPFAVEKVVRGHDTIYVPANAGLDMTGYVIDEPGQNDCDSLRSYSDSLRKDNEFKAIINSLVRGKLEKQTVQWADLAPIEKITEKTTVMKKVALVKVYLGIDAYGGKTGGKYNVDLAPDASFVFADRYMVDLGYYVFNQQLTVGAKVKLSFKKKQ